MKLSTQTRLGTVATFQKTLAVLALSLVALLLLATPALAHVELSSSSPDHGAVLNMPPTQIVLDFSTAAVPAGDGVTLIRGDGSIVPSTIEQTSGEQIALTPTGNLDSGGYSVTWSMRAGDAHPRTGVVTFEVTAVQTGADSTATVDDSVTLTPEAVQAATPPQFETPSTTVGEWFGRVGLWAAMLGTLIAIGAFAFAATSLTGTKREVQEAGYWIRRSGVLIVGGTLLEVVGLSAVLAGSIVGGLAPWSIASAVSGSFGVAVLLRLVGGIAMVQGAAVSVSEHPVPLLHTARFGGGGRTAVLDRPALRAVYRLDIHHSMVALAGVATAALSYVFDGHTVTTAPAVIVRVASVTHVIAAGVWVGGVLLLSVTLANRRRRSEPLDGAAMAIRFSRVAAVALLAVAVAGFALAWAILDSPSELVSTTWGRLLLLKLAAVGAAAAMGAHNHFRVIPSMSEPDPDEDLSERLRKTVRAEAFVLLAVVGITALLVGAAS